MRLLLDGDLGLIGVGDIDVGSDDEPIWKVDEASNLLGAGDEGRDVDGPA